MVKFFYFLCFLLSFSVLSQTTYTREFPQVVECGACFSSWDFEMKAKNSVPNNQGRHIVVFNASTQEFRLRYPHKWAS